LCAFERAFLSFRVTLLFYSRLQAPSHREGEGPLASLSLSLFRRVR
jgi:hypothetical protein